jgi:hypothetical protein
LKTKYHYTLAPLLKISLWLIFFNGFIALAQEEPTPQDTVGYKQGKIKLNNPPSIVSAYTYDPVTDRYIYNSKFGEFNINYPVILTPKEYQELVMRESMRAYFKQKLDAIEGKKAGSEEAKKDLLPTLLRELRFF